MADKEPLIYLIGNYEMAEERNVPDCNDQAPMELDQNILPPALPPTHAYTAKDTTSYNDDTRGYPRAFLSSALNLAAFIEQADKKRKSFYYHGNIAKEAMKHKLQTLHRDFNGASRQARQTIKYNIQKNRLHISKSIVFVNHGLVDSHSILNKQVNRTLENLTAAGRNVRLDMMRTMGRLKPPPVSFRKRHYAALVSAGALGLTTTFAMHAANSNRPPEQNTVQPTFEEQNPIVIATISNAANDRFILADEIEAIAREPISGPISQSSSSEHLRSSPWNINDTAILEIPLEGDFRVSSRYGMRFHPVKRRNIMHDGIDIAAPTGTPIEAPAAGTVKFAGRKGGYGRTVILDHGNGIETLYAHLSRIHVNKGERVEKDEVFAKVGATGRVTGAHLHFEIHRNGRHINPSTHVKEQRERRELRMAAGLSPAAPQGRSLR